MPTPKYGTTSDKMLPPSVQTPPRLTPLGQKKAVQNPVMSQHVSLTPETELRVIEVARLICEGKSKQTCLDYIQSSQGVGIVTAKAYYNAALRWLVPDDLDEYKMGLIQANVERLEKIIEYGISKQNDSKRGADYLRTAKDAIAELNRMLGVGTSKIQVAQNQKGEQIVEINFE